MLFIHMGIEGGSPRAVTMKARNFAKPALLFLLAVWTVGAAAKTTPRMAFTRWMVGTIVSSEGDERQVCFSHTEYVCPRLVPGRDAVLINSLRGGRMGIWLYSFDGSRRRICDGDQVAVSPDGKSIAFRRNGAIYIRSLSDGSERRVSPAGWKDCSFPSFCGTQALVFVRGSGPNAQLYIMKLAGSHAPRLSAKGEISSAPSCSRDGRIVGFQDGAHIYLASAAGGPKRQATWAAGVQSWPVLSSDGKRLAYVQSPTVVDGPRHVYVIDLEKPTKALLAARNVMPGPDWNGVGFEDGYRVEVPVAEASAWKAASASIPLNAPQIAPPKWQQISLPATNLSAAVAVRTSWGALVVGQNSIAFSLGREKGMSAALTVALADSHGNPVTKLSTAYIGQNSPAYIRLKINGLCSGKKRQFTLDIHKAHPLLAIGGDGHAIINANFAAVLIPDRLATDIAVFPQDNASRQIQLPSCPMLVCLADQGLGQLTVLMPSRKQVASVQQQAKQLKAIHVSLGGETIWLGYLRREEVWQTTQMRKAGGKWEILWRNPFPGKWRAALCGSDWAVSRMVVEDSSRRKKWRSLDVISNLPAAPERSFIYCYGRTANTPLTLLTPMDVAYEALGIAAAHELVDLEGIRSYRHAPEFVPYKHPKVCLRLLGFIRNRDRPGGEKKIRDVCRDIKLTFLGLDERLGEYERFTSTMARISGRTKADKQFVQALVDAAKKAQASVREIKIPPRSEVEKAADSYVQGKGKYDALEQAVTQSLDKRLEALSIYRSLARKVRVTATMAFVQGRISRELCEQVRATAWSILRKRYYLEDDWLGEQPLGGPEVPYEKVMGL